MKEYTIYIEGNTVRDLYIKGRVIGLVSVLAGLPDIEFKWSHDKNLETITFKCCDELYNRLVELVGPDIGYFAALWYKNESYNRGESRNRLFSF